MTAAPTSAKGIGTQGHHDHPHVSTT
jgi:hypothetical protein